MKKKILALCLVVILAVTAVTGATLAYFTDTDEAVNTFTAGNVQIDLTEAVVKADEKGNLIADGDKRQDVLENEEDVYDYGKVYPGQSIFKDPTIENLGSEDAYIAAKVIITSDGNLHTYGEDAEGNPLYLLGKSEDYENIDISGIVSGGLAGETVEQSNDYNGLSMVYKNDNYAVYQEPNKADNTYTLYFFMEAPKKTNEKVVLFDTIQIPAEWDNDQMEELKGLKITVEAYAAQAYGFDSCFDAITAAFEEAFPFA